MQQAALPVRDGLIGGHDFARSGCLHPPAERPDTKNTGGKPRRKGGFFPVRLAADSTGRTLPGHERGDQALTKPSRP